MAKRLLGVGLIGAAIAYGYSERDMVSDYLNDTNTPNEQLIESGVLKSFGLAVDVRCVNKENMDAMFDPNLKGRSIPILNTIWLDRKICSEIEAFANEPHKRLASEKQIDALETTTHEVVHMTHMDLFSSTEGEVECYASQITYKLAEGLGASHEDAIKIGEAAARQVRNDQSWLPAEYNITEECRAGGEYDLGDPLRIFP